MSNVTRLQPLQAEYAPNSDHPWTRRASRFFRDMWMLGADADVIAELLHQMLEVVEPKRREIR